jgi:hypothetical protein
MKERMLGENRQSLMILGGDDDERGECHKRGIVTTRRDDET